MCDWIYFVIHLALFFFIGNEVIELNGATSGVTQPVYKTNTKITADCYQSIPTIVVTHKLPCPHVVHTTPIQNIKKRTHNSMFEVHTTPTMFEVHTTPTVHKKLVALECLMLDAPTNNLFHPSFGITTGAPFGVPCVCQHPLQLI